MATLSMPPAADVDDLSSPKIKSGGTANSLSPAVSPPAERGSKSGADMLLGMHAPDGCNDDMMQGLDDSDLTEISKVPRATAAWQQLGERFRPQSDSQVQYANLYFTRLTKLKERAIKAATDSYGNSDAPVVARIRDLEPGVRSILAATTYKEMRLKPNVIDEIKNDTGVSFKSSVGVPSYASDTDSLMIEDESGRLQLITSEESDLDLTPYFSGVVVGLCGTREKGEKFCVESICFPGLAAQTPPPTLAEDKFVALVSDLQVGKPGCNPLAGQMLIDYIAGHLGSSQELTFGASIVRVIVAGNSICTLDEEALRTHEPLNAGQQRSMTDNIRELDTMMTQLCAAVNVDIMPGESDPANQMLPQQPLHRCLLPSTALHDSLQRVTNPYECSVEGVHILGTSGQNVSDMMRYFDNPEGPLGAMRASLQCSHMAPTAPDTLEVVPSEVDPFLLEQCPHVYFAGCQGDRPFETEHMSDAASGSRVRIISLPSFWATGTIGLLNLKTLEASAMQIKVPP